MILDGHDSHNFVELIELAIANRTEIVELPAHWLQPCDQTVFKLLKDKYNEVCQELTNEYQGVVVSKADFSVLPSKAWNKALSWTTSHLDLKPVAYIGSVICVTCRKKSSLQAKIFVGKIL